MADTSSRTAARERRAQALVAEQLVVVVAALGQPVSGEEKRVTRLDAAAHLGIGAAVDHAQRRRFEQDLLDFAGRDAMDEERRHAGGREAHASARVAQQRERHVVALEAETGDAFGHPIQRRS